MRKDLNRMVHALKQVKNPNFEIEPEITPSVRSTTEVDLNLPTEEVKINPKIAAAMKAQEATRKKAEKDKGVINKLTSDLYASGGSFVNKNAFDKLTTDQQRTAFINKDPNYLYYSTKKGS